MPRFALVMLAATALAGSASAKAVSGRWSGYWVSDRTGHTGPLHARVRPLDADTYRAAFLGRFAGVVPFWYSTKLHVVGTGDGVILLAARQRLPLIGEYRTSAVVTAAGFDATFTSRSDSGRFVMTRRR